MSARGLTASDSTPDTAQPPRPRRMVLTACQTDDVSLITQALSVASSSESRETVQELLSRAVTLSIRRSATKVLNYVLGNGAKVPAYSSLNIENPSKEIIEILVAHGWDINSRRIGDQPFLWEVVLVGDGDLVAWCLDHGATAIPKDLCLASDEERRRDETGCSPILEIAASCSTIATFELLRSKGGQQGRRMLHLAAQAAIKTGEGDEDQPNMLDKDRAKLHSERMAMVIHLVDTLGIDSNALDQPRGWMLGNHWGTPLCYVAQSNPNWDCSEVVKFLLQRGADPELVMDPAGWNAVDLARRSKNQRFLDIVEDWKAKQAQST